MAVHGESDYIYGFHDPGNWRWILTEKGRTGWVLVTEEIGYDPNAHSAPDYSDWSDAGFGVLVRLNNGYTPGGTIPHSRQYDSFAKRCANHVGDSRGAHIWIIGNEMNHANEQPGVSFSAGGFTAEELITPDKYAACFKKVRDAIKSLRGHENDQVVLGAVAPYTAVFGYPGNEGKNWVTYFTDILQRLGADVDGIALHAYTHGANPNLIFDEKQPWPQYPGLHYHFRAYRDFMNAIPLHLRHLPVYITETDQSDDGQGRVLPWADTNSGWVRNAYKEIDDWNRAPGNQQIRCLLLYRWGKFDDWYIDGKRGVIDDMQAAAASGYQWSAVPVAGKPAAVARDNLNIRSGPGAHFDRIGVLRAGASAEIVGRSGDGSWLQIVVGGARGWVSAQFANVMGDVAALPVADTGVPSAAPSAAPPAQPTPPSQPAKPPAKITATASEILNVRGGPGTQFKVLGRINKGTVSTVTGRSADSAWVEIAYPDESKRGWLSAQYVTVAGSLGAVPVAGPAAAAPPAPPPAPTRVTATTTDEVNVRSGPGPKFGRIGGIMPGKTYDAVGRSADNTWLQLAYPNAAGRGWISAQFATVSGNLAGLPVASAAPAGPPAQPPAVGVKVTATTTNEVNVRSGPDSKSGRIGGIMPGKTYDVVGRDADNTWLQLAYPNAAGRGWISAQFATVSGNLSAIPIAGAAPTGPAAPTLPAGDRLVIGGFTVTGDMLGFYRAHQQAVGAPISNAVSEGGVETQYFESAVLQAVGGSVRPAPIGREIQAARRAIVDLQARVASLSGASDLSPGRFGFELKDVSASLPLSTDKRWPKRPLSEIGFIVIHHTTAADSLAPAGFARQQVDKQDKPGINVHFYIAGDGTVYQTLPFEALTDHAAGQSRTSIGVALAGNFVGGRQPSDAQLSSAGEVCAWLQARFNLATSRIKGMSEMVPTFQSPGDQWTSGANWKERLLAVSEAVLDSLRGQLPLALTISVPQPPWTDKTKTLPTYNRLPAADKRQGDTLSYPSRALDAIRYLVVHSSAAPASTTVEQIADFQVRTQVKDNAGRVTKEQWPGIGYHFFISGDGSLVKCNELTTVCYHVAGHNPASVGICFAGSFAAGLPPNGAQLAAGGQLIAYLLDQLNLELDAIKGHRELENVDDPGQWTDGAGWRGMLLAAVEAQVTLAA